MAMVQVIDWQSRERFSDVVEQMHRLRKEVFIDFYKWGLSHRDGLEIDQFDTPEALYLLDCDPKTGTLASSLRLLPTTGLHMMESLFPHLCANGYPRGDQVFEISRLFYNPAIQKTGGAALIRAHHRILLGLVEFARHADIQDLIFVTHAKFMARLISYDWDIRPLGFPAADGDQQITAMQLTITAETLPNLQRQFNLFEPVLQSWPDLAAKAA